MASTEPAVPLASKSVRPFLTDVAIVLLAVISLIQLGQTVLSPAGAVFSVPFNVIVLTGAYGLFRMKRWGYYMSLIVSGLQTALGLLGIVGSVIFMRQLQSSPELLQQIQAASDVSLQIPDAAVLIATYQTMLLQTSITTAFYLAALVCVVMARRPAPQQMQPGVETGRAPVVGNSSLAVEVVDLKKVYRIGAVEIPALGGVNLKISKGEFVAIVGPSGSGKSTLLNMLGALDRPTSGQVYIDGIDISRMSSGDLARLRNEKIGFVFQAYNLIPRTTVLRNIELPAMVKGLSRSERFNRASSLLDATGIGNKVTRKPTALSGGEQQRVAIARALVNDPAIVLADEPTGNVDSKVGMEIVGLLRKMNKERGSTIIVVTHNPEVSAATDRIVHLRDGMIEREEILNAT